MKKGQKTLKNGLLEVFENITDDAIDKFLFFRIVGLRFTKIISRDGPAEVGKKTTRAFNVLETESLEVRLERREDIGRLCCLAGKMYEYLHLVEAAGREHRSKIFGRGLFRMDKVELAVEEPVQLLK